MLCLLIPQSHSKIKIVYKLFSVTNNLLLGLVLDFISNNSITPIRYENNIGLYRGPLNFYKQHKYCVFEVSFRNAFVVSFTIFAFSLILFFPCLISGNCRRMKLKFSIMGFIIRFVSQESKAKENERKIKKNEGHVALVFF